MYLREAAFNAFSIYKYYSIYTKPVSHIHPNFFTFYPLLHNLALKSMYFLLILLLLSSSSHVCNARHLHNHHGKDIEDLKHDRTLTPLKPVQFLSSGLHSQKRQPMNGKDGVDERAGSATTKDARDTEALPRDVKGKSGSVSGAVQIGSLVTVSWRIPRAKHGVHPGFNLDYSPPKIHPPSHN